MGTFKPSFEKVIKRKPKKLTYSLKHRNYWQDEFTQKREFRQISQRLGITKHEDWYKYTAKDVYRKGRTPQILH